MNNAELIVAMLQAAGVRWAFGVPSGPVLPLIEAMRGGGIDYVLTSSETSAGFMAHTAGMMTGVPGVCVATVGPGATNLATGVGAAWLDRAPVLAITCNVDSSMLERRVQMRIDHQALFRPLVKDTVALRPGKVAEELRQALALAVSEPPGPVHLDLPEDVAQSRAQEVSLLEPAAPAPLAVIPAHAFDTLVGLLAASHRPLLVGGLELARTSEFRRLGAFAEARGIPFISTLHAKGFLPESSAWFAGVLGRARRSDVQRFIDRADLIVAVGYDPVEINYEEWTGDIPVAHLALQPAEAGAFNLALNAAGDLNDALVRLQDLQPSSYDWTLSEIGEHRARLEAGLRPSVSGFAPHEALDVLRERLPADAILAYDVGAHTHQIATQWHTDRPFTCISTNGWSSMGFGIPAAYAAKLVRPEATVVAVVGDGCFAMTAGELLVARRQGLPVPIVVLNDGWLSLIKVKQQRRELGVHGVRLAEPVSTPPHYFGVPARPAHDARGLSDALDWALALDGPSVIEAFVDASEYDLTVYD